MATILAIIALFTQSVSDTLPFRLVERTTLGSFTHASRVVVDFRNRIFIIDKAIHSVILYQSLLSPPLIVGGYGWKEGAFDTPTDIATDGINIFISDYGNHRIQQFDAQLRFRGVISGKVAYREISFGFPLGIIITPRGETFILDGEEKRILRFSATGLFERFFADRNAQVGKIQNPVRLYLRNNSLYVLEDDCIYQYDTKGTFIRTIGKNIFKNARGLCFINNDILVAAVSTLYLITEDGVVKAVFTLNSIISEKKITEISDIALSGELLYLLTPTTVYVFDVIK